MQLISDIISELASPEKSLVGAFLKTKIFASKVKNSELLDWINLELNGYVGSEAIPIYRKSGCRLVGNWVNSRGFGGYWKGSELDLPISGYGDSWNEYFSTINFTESISALESYSQNKDMYQLEQSLPPDISEIIASQIRSTGNPGFSLIKASKKVSVSVVKDILSRVRSMLLDFMLKIDEEYGFVTDINKLSEQKNIKEKITNIMSKTIINNTGDGNVVNTGNNSEVNVKTIIKKNDLSALKKFLSDNGVPESDISELQTVIDVDKPDVEKKSFGPKVNSWIRKMLDKSLDTSWKIGIGAAGKLLADGIQSYYGMK